MFPISKSESISVVSWFFCDIMLTTSSSNDTMVKFGYRNTYISVIVLFLVRSGGMSGSFSLAIKIMYSSLTTSGQKMIKPWLHQTRMICHRSVPKTITVSNVQHKLLGRSDNGTVQMHVPLGCSGKYLVHTTSLPLKDVWLVLQSLRKFLCSFFLSFIMLAFEAYVPQASSSYQPPPDLILIAMYGTTHCLIK